MNEEWDPSVSPEAFPRVNSPSPSKMSQPYGLDRDLLTGAALAMFATFAKSSEVSDAIRTAGIGALSHWASKIAYEQGEKF